MNKYTCLIILLNIFFLDFLAETYFPMKKIKTQLFNIFVDKFNHTQKYDNISSCIPRKIINTEVKFYRLSPDRQYHYEYRYELNKHNSSLDESRLMLLLTGRGRLCIDWWDFSTGESILSPMRSSGFSLLAICTPRREYKTSVPIQENLDVYWIYITLQIWMHEVYYKHFTHYPRLYLFGISQGSKMASLLSRVLPIQAQILQISPGHRAGLLNHSDYDQAIQNRLVVDYKFANWLYFDYCSKLNLNKIKQCPFDHLNQNYFNPVPPTYFIHHKYDHINHLPEYYSIMSDIKNDSINLGGILLTHNETIKLYIHHREIITPDSMRKHFDRWSCKPWSSQLLYEHFINSTYKTTNKTLRTCFCNSLNLIYYDQYPNITKTWSKTKQNNYRDYVNDIKKFKLNLCETLCGEILATHAMSRINTEDVLGWLKNMDHQRSLYKIKDFLNRPLRLWMYNKFELVDNIKYRTYQTPMNSSCGRYYQATQMYSTEYFLYDYFQRLKKLYPHSQHNFIWAQNPLLADYYIIPHDYVCGIIDYYRPTVTDSEFKSFSINLSQNYLLPLLTNVRTLFPYWNMTSGSNHIIAFTIDRNMGVTADNLTLNTLKHVIQLGFTGVRQDLLPHKSPPLYSFRLGPPVYRHNYDIIIPPFNRLQWLNKKPPMIYSSWNTWYKKKRNLLFFAGTMNNSNSFESVQKHLSLLIKNDIGDGKKYKNIITINGKQLNTINLIDGHISPANYVESIVSSIYHLCPEGYNPWSPRLYESICLGTIPLILAKSIVLPFERFIDWHSFSTKIHINNVKNIIDIIMKIDKFEKYVEEKIKNITKYFHAFRWPYSPINNKFNRHLFLREEDLNGTMKNIFHYLSLELRCRKLEQFYGLTSDSLSNKSINAKRHACKYHSTICPCYEEKKSLAIEQYL